MLRDTRKTFHAFLREPSVHCHNKIYSAAMLMQHYFNIPSYQINTINLVTAHFADTGGNMCNSRLLLQSTALHLTQSCFYKCTLTLPHIILSAYWVICGCTAFRCPCLCTVSGWLCLRCLYTVLLCFDVQVLFCCTDWMHWLFCFTFLCM